MKGADVGQNKWAALAWPGIVELGDMADFHSRRRPKDEVVQRPKTRESLKISPDIRSMINFLMKEWLQMSLRDSVREQWLSLPGHSCHALSVRGLRELHKEKSPINRWFFDSALCLVWTHFVRYCQPKKSDAYHIT
jgi:hypothetical protein